VGNGSISPAFVRIACAVGAPFSFVAAGMCFYFLVQPFGTNPPPREVALGVGIVFTCSSLLLTGMAIFYRGSPVVPAVAERRLESLSGLQRRLPQERSHAAAPSFSEPLPATRPRRSRGLARDLLVTGALLGILIGPGLAYLTYQRQQVLERGKPEPRAFRVAELGKNGPGDNIHVKISDFEFGDKYALTTRNGSWAAIALPAFPTGKLGDSKSLRVLVRTTRVRDERALQEFGKRKEIEGVVINSIYEWEHDKEYMRQAYPGVDTSRIWVVEESYTFPNAGEIKTMYTASSTIIGLAVFCGIGSLMCKRG
jgi:hypothetical protein